MNDAAVNPNSERVDEVVAIDSENSSNDEPVVVIQQKSRKRKRSIANKLSNCINPGCSSSVAPFYSVPMFVLSYYKVRKSGNLRVCSACFDTAVNYYGTLGDMLVKKRPFSSIPRPPLNNVVDIESDIEDLLTESEDEKFGEDSMQLIKSNLDSLFQEVVEEYDLPRHICDIENYLTECTDELKHSGKERKYTLDRLQREIDDMRSSVYHHFRPTIRPEPPIEIFHDVLQDKIQVTDINQQNNKKVSVSTQYETSAEPINSLNDEKNKEHDQITAKTEKNEYKDNVCNKEQSTNDDESYSQDVVAVSEEIMNPPDSLPLPGNILRPRLRVNDIVYVMKLGYEYCWRLGTIVNVSPCGSSAESEETYYVKLNASNPNKENSYKTFKAHQLAYPTESPVRLTVGVRVIAIFRDAQSSDLTKKSTFFSGVIAEPPKPMNKFRYLVFFDDGYTQYVSHGDIRVICKQSQNSWEDTPKESREFIKKYLTEYPERPMVKLNCGDVVKVEYKRKWGLTNVIEVDGSLAKMHFEQDGRTEWIYRGSTRLAPLFEEFVNAQRRKAGDHVRRITISNLNVKKPYVEYTQSIDLDEAETGQEDKMDSSISNSDRRCTARKSTAREARKKPKKWSPVNVPGKVMMKKIVDTMSPKKFFPHQCGITCIKWTKFVPSKAYNIGPLAIPMNFGFRRVICRFRSDKQVVSYIAPCGRRLRNMEEVHRYLRITKSTMTVDMFDFDYWVKCLAEFIINQPVIVNLEDITQNKENNRINCVNYIDGSIPEFTGYMTTREPREDVNLNLDKEFLSGCDCTDDCQDKSKCSCWQLTIQGQELIPGNFIDPNVGYHYRRLPERVLTGIYECNSRCKCSKVTCLNRVVQYPISQKLQLFKTEMKGWGIRSLNDIPQGSFICIYVGHLLTEHVANEEGKNYGDEYLAELDYIEVMERIKEDYEADVPEYLSDVDSSTNDNQDENKSDETSVSSSDDEDEPSGIRSRLRKRESKKTTVDNSEAKKQVTQTKKGANLSFMAPSTLDDSPVKKHSSIRDYYGENESVYVMDAKSNGNIGRYLNHSCNPNVFVQSVFVDTHDLRFPWIAFFALTYIQAGSELTWDYNYNIGSVENKIMYCYCGSDQCRRRLL